MIEVGATEGAHESLVGEGVFACEPIKMRPLAMIGAHRQRTDIGPGDEHVIATTVDLHLVLIETMHRYRGQDVGGRIVGRLADKERPVGHRSRIGGIGLGRFDMFGVGGNLVGGPQRRQMR